MTIIADDLTGALDTAVQFSKKGAATVVIADTADMRGFSDCPKNYDVVAINTKSRHLPPKKAAEAVRSAVRLAMCFGGGAGGLSYYKKIDSTLRGNVGAELEALLDICGGGELMLVPSYCKLGRTVRGGRLYVDNVPVNETAFGKDPLNPVTKSDITEIIAGQTDIPVIPQKNPADLPPARSESKGERKIYLFDAETDGDIQKIGEQLAARNRTGITAGSAGFAEFLSDTPPFFRQRPKEPKFAFPMLTVCGSLHEASRRQTEYAAGLGYRVIGIDFETTGGHALEWAKEQAIESLKKGDKTIIQTNPGGSLDSSDIPEALGCFVKSVIDGSQISSLAIFGGDTTAGILKIMGIVCLEPLLEVVPGVVLSKTVNSPYNLNLITKAGGFGGEDLLEKIERIASRLNRN